MSCACYLDPINGEDVYQCSHGDCSYRRAVYGNKVSTCVHVKSYMTNLDYTFSVPFTRSHLVNGTLTVYHGFGARLVMVTVADPNGFQLPAKGFSVYYTSKDELVLDCSAYPLLQGQYVVTITFPSQKHVCECTNPEAKLEVRMEAL